MQKQASFIFGCTIWPRVSGIFLFIVTWVCQEDIKFESSVYLLVSAKAKSDM